MPRKAKPRTPEQQERDTDLRLQRTYGITLAEYNERLAQQGGGCAICGKPPAAKRLHTDHCHKFAKAFKLLYTKMEDGVLVETIDRSNPTRRFYIGFKSATRKVAAATVRSLLKKYSVRGLLCWNCNRGLRVFADNARSLERAGQYLRDFAARTI